VAIRKKVTHRRHGATHDTETDAPTIPVMSYTNVGLAELIVMAWDNGTFSWPAVPAIPGPGGFPGWTAGMVPHLQDALLERNPPNSKIPSADAVKVATNAVNILAGMDLRRAVVISEAEHDDDYTMQTDDEVVFVLPNNARAVLPNPIPGPPRPPHILETAKLLMACTPNGI
jgi:hypothetical protein